MKLNRGNHSAVNGTSVALAPERIAHIGIGAFAKSHQIWFTNAVDPNKEWGVVAFTGRTPDAALSLSDQNGLYTLVERGKTDDHFQIIDSIVRAEDGNNATAFSETISNPNTAVVTLTITESGYAIEPPSPAVHRLAVALDLRRRLNAQPIALVSCDNLPNNGERLKRVILHVFESFEPEATDWLLSEVSFVSTSVDRITPKVTAADSQQVLAETNWHDANVTVTEPFQNWVLSGEFPLGRPNWELAGAKFVDEIEPFENRKLWLLNGAHSILAYSGILRGHLTVAEAIDDQYCLDLVEAFWREASNHLTAGELDLGNYKNSLLERFGNGRIAHRLSQIAMDGATKLAVRIVPVALAELGEGRTASGSARAISAWLDFVEQTNSISDSRIDEIRLALKQKSPRLALVALLNPELATDQRFINQLEKEAQC